MTPGALVRERRMELGWSQAQLAAAAATTQAVVSRIERNASSPTVDMLLRLAQAMDSELSLTLTPH